MTYKKIKAEVEKILNKPNYLGKMPKFVVEPKPPVQPLVNEVVKRVLEYQWQTIWKDWNKRMGKFYRKSSRQRHNYQTVKWD